MQKFRFFFVFVFIIILGQIFAEPNDSENRDKTLGIRFKMGDIIGDNKSIDLLWDINQRFALEGSLSLSFDHIKDPLGSSTTFEFSPAIFPQIKLLNSQRPTIYTGILFGYWHRENQVIAEDGLLLSVPLEARYKIFSSLEITGGIGILARYKFPGQSIDVYNSSESRTEIMTITTDLGVIIFLF
ncbi:MAG: hypothetical protein PHC61_12150 [Chitinivibrionales bacterium]|nr:hypothetical protein [Chitinivibrionales bacterium]